MSDITQYCMLCGLETEPLVCDSCGIPLCKPCSSHHDTSRCKELLVCKEHNNLVTRFCVQCCKICCITCDCQEKGHSTVYLRVAFANIRDEIGRCLQGLGQRLKLEESYSENIIESQRAVTAKTEEVKQVSKSIQDRITNVEISLTQHLQESLDKITKLANETTSVKAGLKNSEQNLTCLFNEQDPLIFLWKWYNNRDDDDVCNHYDSFIKEREEKKSKDRIGYGEEYTDISGLFIKALFKSGQNASGTEANPGALVSSMPALLLSSQNTVEERQRYETGAALEYGTEETDMETDSNTEPASHTMPESQTSAGETDKENNECLKVLKCMLDISAGLPNIIDTLTEKIGPRGFITLPRVTEKYKDQVNTFIEHVERAHNYIVQLNNDIIKLRDEKVKMSNEASKRENYYLRQLNELEKMANQSIFGRLFKSKDEHKRSSNDSYDRQFEIEAKAVTEISEIQHKLEELKSFHSKQLENMTKEKDDLQSRLSSIAGEQLTKGNPAITDLGDPNRPMKIGEKYGELYDNEWTDSMEFVDDIKELFPDVEQKEHDNIVIHYLHRILLECFRDCKIESQIQMRALGFSTSEDNTDQDQKSKRQKGTFLKEGDFNLERRRNAESFSTYLCQEKMICKNLLANWDYPWKNEKFLDKLIATPYFQKCVTLCWYMVIQDPMMYLDEPLDKDSPFDKGLYKEFVQKGDKVEFVVWPALYLHKGGPLLYKGVVQAYTPDKEIKDDN